MGEIETRGRAGETESEEQPVLAAGDEQGGKTEGGDGGETDETVEALGRCLEPQDGEPQRALRPQLSTLLSCCGNDWRAGVAVD